jgi:uncharacterized protein (DUF1501 family)
MKLTDREILELNELCNAAVDETLSEAQKARLTRLLQTSEEARRFYIRVLGVSASLYSYAGEMQAEAPDLQDVSGESEATKKLYGLDKPITEDFGRQCLMARRLSEKGVRFVQVSHTYKWDQHSELLRDHAQNAKEVDQPIAGLLADLKARGLLKDTLVVWGGEFGRTPTAEGSDGRDHNPEAFTYFLAGGGVKPGLEWGATDDYGYYSVENKVHFHDLHATILYLLGLDHKRLTYRYAGRDFRLTDVHGEVVNGIVA